MNWIYRSLIDFVTISKWSALYHWIWPDKHVWYEKILEGSSFPRFKHFCIFLWTYIGCFQWIPFFIKMCLWAKKELKTLTSVAFSKKVNSTDEAEQYGKRCSSYCTVKESQMPNHLRKLQSNKVQWEKVFSLRNLTFHTFNLC